MLLKVESSPAEIAAEPVSREHCDENVRIRMSWLENSGSLCIAAPFMFLYIWLSYSCSCFFINGDNYALRFFFLRKNARFNSLQSFAIDNAWHRNRTHREIMKNSSCMKGNHIPFTGLPRILR